MEKQEFYVNYEDLNYAPAKDSWENIQSLPEESEGTLSVFYLNLKYAGEIYLPISIFKNKLTPLQVVIKYLRENLSKSNKQIAMLLGRDQRAIWSTYKSVEKAKIEWKEDSDIQVPLEIFRDEKLSAFEALVIFLLNLELNYSDIARLLGKDPRTIWTVYSRAKKKMNQSNHEKQ
ncbi:MAG TPA: hypothetical protein VJ461_04145 [Candidatus Nanoarchaeia archaeon]|nr:hypothetical protein [Candidatus Nanoarchaeia archaeon]